MERPPARCAGSVRFADDAVVMCSSRQQAEAALARLRAVLAELGLELKAAKTKIVHLTENGDGLDFLGFHHRWVRSPGRMGAKGVAFLGRWPADKAMQHTRDQIRELTDRRRTLLRGETVVGDINRFLRGWAGYFRYGNSAVRFNKIRNYAVMRLAGFIAKKHRRFRAFGRRVIFTSANQLGLIRLDGTVIAPRPFRAWRVVPNAGGERRR
ncbi:group II intron maturase-specific domain-containing protein [Saccharopolyspora sp. NPDC002686]|uniref:group II intron maturase-specific domain-containing protein n=1 Tax=Saccharopolyspora sp. NPDC002686 TaxID=3154541 RepID=UPI003325474A